MASDRENQAPSKVNTPVLPHLRVPPTLSTFSVSPEAMADDTHKQLEEYRQKYEKEKLSTGELRKDIKDLEMALENEREVQQKGQNSNIEAEKEANYRSYEQARVKCEALQREKASLEARVKSSEYQREQQENNYKQLAAEYASVKEKFAAEKHKNDSQKGQVKNTDKKWADLRNDVRKREAETAQALAQKDEKIAQLEARIPRETNVLIKDLELKDDQIRELYQQFAADQEEKKGLEGDISKLSDKHYEETKQLKEQLRTVRLEKQRMMVQEANGDEGEESGEDEEATPQQGPLGGGGKKKRRRKRRAGGGSKKSTMQTITDQEGDTMHGFSAQEEDAIAAQDEEKTDTDISEKSVDKDRTPRPLRQQLGNLSQSEFGSEVEDLPLEHEEPRDETRTEGGNYRNRATICDEIVQTHSNMSNQSGPTNVDMSDQLVQTDGNVQTDVNASDQLVRTDLTVHTDVNMSDQLVETDGNVQTDVNTSDQLVRTDLIVHANVNMSDQLVQTDRNVQTDVNTSDRLIQTDPIIQIDKLVQTDPIVHTDVNKSDQLVQTDPIDAPTATVITLPAQKSKNSGLKYYNIFVVLFLLAWFTMWLWECRKSEIARSQVSSCLSFGCRLVYKATETADGYWAIQRAGGTKTAPFPSMSAPFPSMSAPFPTMTQI